MIKVDTVYNVHSVHPGAVLSATPSPAWAQALDAYIAWAQARGPNPGVGGEVHFADAAIHANFELRVNSIVISLRPGSTYTDVAAFIDQAIAHANHVSPEG
jgi:hypothetical protein